MNWPALAARVLEGYALTDDEALAVLNAPDAAVLDVMAAAYRIRRHFYGNVVKLNYLVNAKSGLCPEDCGYCSQSRHSTAPINKYPLMDKGEIVARAQQAVDAQASTCCLVISGRGPSNKEVAHISSAVRTIKEKHPQLKVCACMGLLRDDQAERLKAAGVDRYNHNVNTAASHHDEIVSSHTYDDRVGTVEQAKQADISPCSGVIIGMGERREQIVESAFALRDLGADSIPVNFLLPIEGTPMHADGRRAQHITPRFALKVLALFRFVCPDREIRISAGREVHLRSLQPMALYAANALFVSDYLTEPGQDASEDVQMIEDLGFEVEPMGAPPIRDASADAAPASASPSGDGAATPKPAASASS